MPGKKLIVFTDLDGTLLDARTYSFAPAAGALKRLEKLGVPVVICTSKTRAEVMQWRERIGNVHPFIIENGGGVYIPAGYFGHAVHPGKVSGDYEVVEFGTPYAKLREAVAALRAEGYDITGFGDMTDEEVAALTGLPFEEAAMARAREFDEPFVLGGSGDALPSLLEAIKRMGLNYTEGRLMHILGDNDKGRAMRYLADLYKKRHGKIVMAALGDSLNDAPMLMSVDHPFLVKKPEGFHTPSITNERVTKVEGAGPEGWAQAVKLLLGKLRLV